MNQKPDITTCATRVDPRILSLMAPTPRELQRKHWDGIAADPVGGLVNDLQGRGKPSVAWVVMWTERAEPWGLVDPVAAAWRESRDAWAMIGLLCWAGHPGGPVIYRNQVGATEITGSLRGKLMGIDPNRVRKDAARFGPVPTLAELLVIKRQPLTGVVALR
jgi:hypothetical protein